MDRRAFLSLGDEFQIERITCTPTALRVEVVSAAVSVRCPLCQHVAWRRHSCYTRWIADLPCAGQHVLLAVTVRKFFCQNPACPRQIFTERLAQLVQPGARKTNRLLNQSVTHGPERAGVGRWWRDRYATGCETGHPDQPIHALALPHAAASAGDAPNAHPGRG